MFSNRWDIFDRPHHLWDQYVGSRLEPDDLLRSEEPSLMIICPRKQHSRSYHPYAKSLARKSAAASTLHADKNQFRMSLDVQQFTPDEITVKVSGRNVIVEGKHEEKQDEHGWVSRQFVRRYHVPEQCDVDQLQSHLSSDGVLNITCPRKQALEDKKERLIPIQQTGQPAIVDKPTTSNAAVTESGSPAKTPGTQTRAQEKAAKTVKAA